MIRHPNRVVAWHRQACVGVLIAALFSGAAPSWADPALPEPVLPQPSCVDLSVGMLEWTSPDGKSGRRIKVAEWLDSKEVKRTHIELLLPLDKDAAMAWKKPRRMHVVITRLPAPHPGLWKDDVPAWDKNSNQHGDPSYVSAKVKREGFQQLIDVADGNEKVLRSLEWYGDWGELEPNQPKQPVLLEWMSGYENGYEIVRPRFIHSADGYFRGFEGYRLMGKGWEFAPKFHAHLLNPDRTMMLEFSLSLKGEPELQDRKPGKGTRKLAEENYRLLQEDFPGEAYRGVAETVRRAREVVKTLRWRDAHGKLVPAS